MFAMLTSQTSAVLVTLAILLAVADQYAAAQYSSSRGGSSSGGAVGSSSNGYRKNGNNKNMMPLEMMIFSPMVMGEQKGGYSSKTMQPSKSGYESSKPKMTLYDMGGSSYQSMPVRAAVQSKHSVEHRDVPTEPLNIQPQTILVEAMNIPLNILFQSKSSHINLQSEHIPSEGSNQETQSEDEPHILKHTVTKPILQNVYEVITPYRKITQEIKPVVESVTTVIARQVPSENKYEAVNSAKYGSMEQAQPQPQQQQPKAQASRSSSYSNSNEQVLAQMMKALKMEIPKQFLQMGGFGYSQPAKQSRMQMYMSQLGEEQQQQQTESLEQEAESSQSLGTSKGESLPLELAEPELKGEGSPTTTVDDVNIGEEQEVNSGETSTQDSLKATAEKGGSRGMPFMIYSGKGPVAEAKLAANGAAKIGLVQKSFLQGSNLEPSGY